MIENTFSIHIYIYIYIYIEYLIVSNLKQNSIKKHFNCLYQTQYVIRRISVVTCIFGWNCLIIYKTHSNDEEGTPVLHRPGPLWTVLTIVVHVK